MANSKKLEKGLTEVLQNVETATLTRKNNTTDPEITNDGNNNIIKISSNCKINCNNSNSSTSNGSTNGSSNNNGNNSSNITSSRSSLSSCYFKCCSSSNSIISFIISSLSCCCSTDFHICCWSWQDLTNNNGTSCKTATSMPSPSPPPSSTSSFSSSFWNNKLYFSISSLKLYFLLWLFSSILVPCCSLSMTEVRIPKHIMRYENAALGCKYDLDGESLYSVKWYKDGFEFYRYVPRDMPPGQVFPLPGVDVDLQNSTDNVVVLHRVTLQSTGRYRCEVSGEAPSFQTVSGHEDMIVVVTPLKGPQITGGQPRYSIGEKVSVNCTSAPSKPICHLSWLINGVHANRSYLRYYEPKIVGREGLEVATLGLEFRVRG